GLLAGKKLSSLYFGGGTPSLIGKRDLEKLFAFLRSYFQWEELKESTIETIPEIITTERVSLWKEFFNRISVGIQSLNPTLLRIIGRKSAKDKISDPNEVMRKLDILSQSIGETPLRINFDLIYGIPTQTPEHILADITEIMKRINPPMLSFTLYRLRLHRGTSYSALYRRKDELHLPTQQYTYALYYVVSQHLNS
ncbi:MAG: radical SAM protein, partial [Fervidobacterium pennivorans]